MNRIEFDLGKTAHKQAVQLVAKKVEGVYLYDLVKQPGGQMDDKVTLFDQPEEVIEAIVIAFNKMQAIQS